MQVAPERFSLVKYDADEIAAVVIEMAELIGLSNPISVFVDETTPLAKMSAEVDGTSSDAPIVVRVESGALEDTRHLTNFSPERARQRLGRVMLRARDRLRPDFADAPPDLELTNPQNSAWDVYCGGRLERLGIEVPTQRFRYDFRNRFGFSDEIDRLFDQLWASDDLGWADLPTAD